jgi:hypothetical protein
MKPFLRSIGLALGAFVFVGAASVAIAEENATGTKKATGTSSFVTTLRESVAKTLATPPAAPARAPIQKTRGVVPLAWIDPPGDWCGVYEPCNAEACPDEPDNWRCFPYFYP